MKSIQEKIRLTVMGVLFASLAVTGILSIVLNLRGTQETFLPFPSSPNPTDGRSESTPQSGNSYHPHAVDFTRHYQRGFALLEASIWSIKDSLNPAFRQIAQSSDQVANGSEYVSSSGISQE